MLGRHEIRRVFDPSVNDKDVQAALADRSEDGCAAELDMALVARPKPSSARRSSDLLKGAAGVTALMLAARGGHKELVEALIDSEPAAVHHRQRGSQPKEPPDTPTESTPRGCTALEMAARPCGRRSGCR